MEYAHVYKRKKDGKLLISPSYKTEIGYRTDFSAYELLDGAASLDELGHAVREAYQRILLFYKGEFIEQENTNDVMLALGKAYGSNAKRVRDLKLASVRFDDNGEIEVALWTKGPSNSFVNRKPEEKRRLAPDASDSELGMAIQNLLDLFG